MYARPYGLPAYDGNPARLLPGPAQCPPTG
jgi:hypothetical protein